MLLTPRLYAALICLALAAGLHAAPGAASLPDQRAVAPLAPPASSHPAAAAPVAPLSFALIGDLPYGRGEASRFDALLEDINADPSVRLVLHAGDIKGSTESCDDALLRERHAQLLLLRAPLAYTPGDNEWTDCHRRGAGAFNPLERLRFLRQLFFPLPNRLTISATSTGVAAPERHPQSADPRFAEFVENGWFTAGGVVFATVHVVGSNNGLEPWVGLDPQDHKRTPRAERVAEVARRIDAAVAWLDTVFGVARRDNAAAVVLLMQANPRLEDAPTDSNRAGFNPFLSALQRHARAFAKPVLLAHGDEHSFLLDRPFDSDDGTGLRNLMRVQTFGSPRVRWIKVTVDPLQAEVFDVVPMPGPAHDRRLVPGGR